MNKKELKKKPYVRLSMEVIKVKADTQILSGSPAVQPGGGGVTVIPPTEDEDDTEISSAKRFSMWDKWDED